MIHASSSSPIRLKKDCGNEDNNFFDWAVKNKLKVESITLDDPDGYESILNEQSIRIGNTTTKEEDVTDQLHALVFDLEALDNELEDIYDLDAGIEQAGID
jgi:hypothetical protein